MSAFSTLAQYPDVFADLVVTRCARGKVSLTHHSEPFPDRGLVVISRNGAFPVKTRGVWDRQHDLIVRLDGIKKPVKLSELQGMVEPLGLDVSVLFASDNTGDEAKRAIDNGFLATAPIWLPDGYAEHYAQHFQEYLRSSREERGEAEERTPE